jgi:ribose transport system substrate-binding protein
MKKISILILVVFLVQLATGCATPATPATQAPPVNTQPPAANTQAPAAVEPTPIPFPEPAAGTVMVDTTRFKKAPPWTIAYANASTSNSWRIYTVASLYWAATEYPDLIKGIVHTNANDSVPKQISDMEDLITQKVDAIILAGTSGSALNPVIDKAMAANIPVIILERGVDTDNYVTFIDVNSKAVATTQAEWLANQLGGKGNVVFFGVVPGITLSKWQEDAVRAVWAKNPGIKELAFDYGMVSRSTGKTLMEAWLQSFPQIDGVIGWTGSEIQGAVEAAKEANRYDQIKAWVGADEMGYLKLIKGGLNGAGYIGYADCSVDALQAAIKILKGEQVPKSWLLKPTLITKENIDKYLIPDAPDTWFPSRIPATEVQKWLDLAATK